MSAGDVVFIIGGPVVLILPILLMIGPAMALVGMFAYTVLFIGPS